MRGSPRAAAPRRRGRLLFESGETGLSESVRLVEHPSFSIEETLEEGHLYHPIPRGAVNSGPRRTSGRHGKSMTYRYRQGPAPWTIGPFVNTSFAVTIALSTGERVSG